MSAQKLPRTATKKQVYAAMELIYKDRKGRYRYRHRSIRRDFFTDTYLAALGLSRAEWNSMRVLKYSILVQICADFDISASDFI